MKTLSSPKGDGALEAKVEELQRNGTPPRPQLRKMRRRSTLEWANATPQRRQERLERVTEERLADVFFSLHLREFEGEIRFLFPLLAGMQVSDGNDSRTYLHLGNGEEDDEPHLSACRFLCVCARSHEARTCDCEGLGETLRAR